MARFDNREILAAYEFVFPSPMIQTDPLYAEWALDVFRPNVSDIGRSAWADKQDFYRDLYMTPGPPPLQPL